MRKEQTAVVVGAGVIGAAIALELSRNAYTVTVIDAGPGPGTGSTSASSAIVRYHYANIDEAVIAWESAQRWASWSTHLGHRDPAGMAQFHPCGLLMLAGPLIDMGGALRNMTTLGIEVIELDAGQVRDRFPALDPSRFGPPSRPDDDQFWADPNGDTTAYWMPQCGFVDDPQLAAHNLAHAAACHGATFRHHSTVTAVLRDGGRACGVGLAAGEPLLADVVINAAGPWSGQLNALAGVLDDFTATTRPLEQQIVTLPAPDGFTVTGGACVADADLGTYFRPHPGGTLVVGGMEAPCDPLTWLENPHDARERIDVDTWNTQTLRVARRIPGTGIPGRPTGIVGVYDVSDDWIPIYDRTSLPGFYVAIGSSGHGFKSAPVVGELMAGLISACEAGHPHDTDPLHLPAPRTGQTVNMGTFSRRRTVHAKARMG